MAANGAIALKGQIGGEQARYQRGGWQPRPNGTEGRGEPRPLPKPLEVVTKLGEMDCLPAIYFLFGRRLVEGAASSCLDSAFRGQARRRAGRHFPMGTCRNCPPRTARCVR
ncbi:MAG: hypothetical protein KIS91_01555 [Anaerolineae bacterium]|nr:hypothetical protein [Anaerolineae bacterium]